MATTPIIVSGSGFSSLIPYNDATENTVDQGDSGVSGAATFPITRWTQIPHNIYRSNHKVGVLAFHATGIKEVEFRLNDGTTVGITEPSFNSETGLNEYCVEIDRNSIINNYSGGETANNCELRAIIRPNHGKVRILQHDIQGISGDTAKVLYGIKGVSGGLPSGMGRDFDTFAHSGEHSFLATFLKNEELSSMPTEEVFISPNGTEITVDNFESITDWNNIGTRSNPAKRIRDYIPIIRARNGFPPFQRTSATSNEFDNMYFIKGPGVITLLPGEYNEYHYCIRYTSEEQLIFFGNANAWFKDQCITDHKKMFIVRGDPNASRDQIVLRLENKDTIIGETETSLSTDNINNKSFNISRFLRLPMFQMENMTLDRDQDKESGINLMINLSSGSVRIASGSFTYPHIPPVGGLFVFRNMHIKTFSPAHDYFTFLGNGAGLINGGPMTFNCLIEGGSSITKGFKGFIANSWLKNHGGDQTVYQAMNYGNLIDSMPDTFVVPELIKFTPTEETKGAEYEHFNGWYASTRSGFDNLLNRLAPDGGDGNGNDGFTRDNKISKIGTVWRKINEDAVMGLISDVPELKDPAFRTGDPFGGFGSASPNNDYMSHDPISSTDDRVRIFGGPAQRFYDSVTTTRVNEQIPEGSVNKYNDVYYENKFFALVEHVDELGNKTAGWILADADKPLVYGDGPNQQKYLWRYSGTTGAAPEHRLGHTGDFYYGNRLVSYNYGFAEGFTTTLPPQFGGKIEPIPDGVTTDAYPVSGSAIRGMEDGDHPDCSQYFCDGRLTDFGTTTSDPIAYVENGAENIIIAYNKWLNVPEQIGNWGGPQPLSDGQVSGHYDIVPEGSQTTTALPFKDIAMINNVITTTKENNESGGGNWAIGMAIQNFLVEHNTIIGASKFGLRLGNNWTLVTTPGATMHGVTYDRDLTGKYYDKTSHNIFIRNNYLDAIAGSNFSTLGITYETSSGVVLYGGGEFWFDHEHGNSYSSLFQPLVREGNVLYKTPGIIEGIGNGNQNVYNTMGVTGVISLPIEADPLFNNAFTDAMIDQFSPLVGGATQSYIYDDIKREKRNDRATVGAYEPIFDEDYTSVNTATSSTTSLPLSSIDPEILYGKKYKVVAFHDGTELSSTNEKVFEHRWRYFNEDTSRQNVSGGVTDDSISYTYDFIRGPRDNQALYLPEQNDVQFISTSDWLVSRYNLQFMKLVDSNYPSDGNRIYLFFASDGDRTNWKNSFTKDIECIPSELSISSGNNIFIDKSTEEDTSVLGGSFIHGVRYHFRDISGVSFDIPENTAGTSYIGTWTIKDNT